MTKEPNKPGRDASGDDDVGKTPPEPVDAGDPLAVDPLEEAAGDRESADTVSPPAAPADRESAAGAPRPRGGGRMLASLAFLLALAALGGAGYLYYELIHTSETAQVRASVRALESELGSMDERFDELAARQREELERFRRQQEQARAATEQALSESLADVARQAPPSTTEWRRAEARYLLRIANHRLLMERDVEGALRLLEAADAILADLDDFALHRVRARLADEIAALESVEGTDVQGLFLRLEAVKRQLDELPLRLPQYAGGEAEPPPPDEGVWRTLRRELSGMLEFRRLDQEVKPLLAPEEAVYLELNLRLMLERAQIAAVRREQLVFEESIATAVDWIHQYLDLDKPAVQRMLDELTALEEVDLAQPLPDISGSLNALREVMREPS